MNIFHFQVDLFTADVHNFTNTFPLQYAGKNVRGNFSSMKHRPIHLVRFARYQITAV